MVLYKSFCLDGWFKCITDFYFYFPKGWEYHEKQIDIFMNNEMKSTQLQYFENFHIGRCKIIVCVVLLTDGAQPAIMYCSFYIDDLILRFQTLRTREQDKT